MQKKQNNKIHIVYIRFAFPLPDEPGPKRPLEIAARYRSMGHRITVITSSCNWMTGHVREKVRGLFSYHIENGLEYVRVAAVPKYRSSMVRRLLNYAVFMVLSFWSGTRLISKSEENVIIFVDISPPFTVMGGYFLSRLRKNARLVLEITDLPEAVFELGMFDSVIVRTITQSIFKYIYRASDHMITLSRGAKKHIVDLGIPESKITTVPNWINNVHTATYDTEREKIRNKFGWNDKFVVMYTGGHGRAYDLMTLMETAEILKRTDNLAIVLVGEGERKKEYIAFCEKKKLTHCYFIPAVTRNDLPAYLASADVCINIFHEGNFWKKVIGHKIFDYFEASRPIIFAGNGDTADLIRDAQGGKVVSPGKPKELGKAILEMKDNIEETQLMGSKGRTYLEKEYNKEDILKRLDSIFKM